MNPEITFSEQDTGKEVVTAAGDVVGTVTAVSDDSATVEPHENLSAELTESLGWDAGNAKTHVLTTDQVSGVTDDAVQVSGTSWSQ